MCNSSSSPTKISKSGKRQKRRGNIQMNIDGQSLEPTHALVYNHETGQERTFKKELKDWEARRGQMLFFIGSRWEVSGEGV
jgi:hypothetical protein